MILFYSFLETNIVNIGFYLVFEILLSKLICWTLQVDTVSKRKKLLLLSSKRGVSITSILSGFFAFIAVAFLLINLGSSICRNWDFSPSKGRGTCSGKGGIMVDYRNYYGAVFQIATFFGASASLITISLFGSKKSKS